jgi:hypothetical protein
MADRVFGRGLLGGGDDSRPETFEINDETMAAYAEAAGRRAREIEAQTGPLVIEV